MLYSATSPHIFLASKGGMPPELKRVYCYQLGSDNCYKVGLTKNPPPARMRGLATGSPVKLKFYRAVETENASGLEKYIHQLLDAKRAENGEFFHVNRQELDDGTTAGGGRHSSGTVFEITK